MRHDGHCGIVDPAAAAAAAPVALVAAVVAAAGPALVKPEHWCLVAEVDGADEPTAIVSQA
jgi:hypothetical protein